MNSFEPSKMISHGVRVYGRVAVSFIGGETGLPGENHRSVASHRQT